MFGKDGFEDAEKQICKIEGELGFADLAQFTPSPPPKPQLKLSRASEHHLSKPGGTNQSSNLWDGSFLAAMVDGSVGLNPDRSGK
jgi:hypothetical protein